jgi:hypothetical protein
LAAVVSGDEHPLLTVIAEHSVTLLAVIRMIVDEVDGPTTPPDTPPDGGTEPESTDDAARARRYQPIAVTVEE